MFNIHFKYALSIPTVVYIGYYAWTINVVVFWYNLI